MEQKTNRVVWVDWMRVLACLMVMIVHSTEPFYLGGNGALILSESDAWWAAFFDSFVRCCVPLFVVASSYLQFPLHYGTGEFFRRRAVRILVPFAVWSVFYAFYWGEPVSNLKDLLLNFNYAAGHLWFVYMIIGLYVIMPLLSPWAVKVGKKELSAYIFVWLLTTLIPLVRAWVSGAPDAFAYGPTGIPRQALYPLWGEASWNSYGAFYYVSGFIGYLLIGLWLRKFGDGLSAKRSILVGIPCFLAGFAVVFGGFLRRVFDMAGGQFPVGNLVNDAVWWETTWCNDTVGVALMTIGLILVLRNITSSGKFYERIILPVSKASYGMYLGHMVALSFFSALYRGMIVSTPLTILATAFSSFAVVAVVAVLVRKIPVIGKYIIG
ncbi:MAG: acyltransferase family protein [Bacteroidales bacterium]|nr:acyltransferase family protein [Bacteroidales bacterium]